MFEKCTRVICLGSLINLLNLWGFSFFSNENIFVTKFYSVFLTNGIFIENKRVVFLTRCSYCKGKSVPCYFHSRRAFHFFVLDKIFFPGILNKNLFLIIWNKRCITFMILRTKIFFIFENLTRWISFSFQYFFNNFYIIKKVLWMW